MWKIIIVPVFLLSVFSGCDSQYKESLANAKINACQLKKAMAEVEKDPNNKKALEEVREYTEFLKMHEEQSGKPEKLRKEIAKFVEGGGCK